MVVSGTLKSKKNKRHGEPSRGFTLLEVMVASALMMTFILFGSSLVNEGAKQIIDKGRYLELNSHIDEWSKLVKQQDFYSEGLAPGAHQMEVKGSNQNVYYLEWNVQLLNPMVKGVSFSIRDPSNNELIYEWKSGVLFKL